MNPYAASNVAAGTVMPGETVVWSGKAPTGVRFRAMDALLVPFSLIWCGFAVFWETGVVLGHGPLIFRLWGVPFVVVGLYVVAGRFAADAYLRARTSYAVTDRAAYVVRVGPFAAERRFGPTALDALVLEPHDVGGGTIRFVVETSRLRNPWSPSTLEVFEDIPDVRRVYELLVAARDRR